MTSPMIHILHVSLEFFSEEDVLCNHGSGQQDSPEASQTPGKNSFDSELLHLVGTGGPDQSSCNEITASQLDYGWF